MVTWTCVDLQDDHVQPLEVEDLKEQVEAVMVAHEAPEHAQCLPKAMGAFPEVERGVQVANEGSGIVWKHPETSLGGIWVVL